MFVCVGRCVWGGKVVGEGGMCGEVVRRHSIHGVGIKVKGRDDNGVVKYAATFTCVCVYM